MATTTTISYKELKEEFVSGWFVGNVAVGSHNLNQQQQHKQCHSSINIHRKNEKRLPIESRRCGRDRFVLDSHVAVSNDLVRYVRKSLFTTSDTD
jgi:hypothetical protein